MGGRERAREKRFTDVGTSVVCPPRTCARYALQRPHHTHRARSHLPTHARARTRARARTQSTISCVDAPYTIGNTNCKIHYNTNRKHFYSFPSSISPTRRAIHRKAAPQASTQECYVSGQGGCRREQSGREREGETEYRLRYSLSTVWPPTWRVGGRGGCPAVPHPQVDRSDA